MGEADRAVVVQRSTNDANSQDIWPNFRGN